MNKNNNISPLPFYLSKEEWNSRRSYSYGDIYPLYTLANTLLSFQIVRSRDNVQGHNVTAARLYRANGTLVADILNGLQQTGLGTITFPAQGYDVIYYRGGMPYMSAQYDGQYYIRLTDNEGDMYSEIFTVVQDISAYLKIEWYDSEDLVFDGGRIVYDTPSKYRNALYFAAELGKPEYTFEEEGETRDGLFFPEKQLSEKKYKCTILAPEYLCDVMRFIRMADYVRVTDKYGRIYDCDTFLITPEWQLQGNLARVEIEFETDTVAKKIGRAIMPNNGNFNDDYNDDYDNV